MTKKDNKEKRLLDDALQTIGTPYLLQNIIDQMQRELKICKESLSESVADQKYYRNTAQHNKQLLKIVKREIRDVTKELQHNKKLIKLLQSASKMLKTMPNII